MSIIILRRNYLADAVNNKSGYHGTFVRCEISQTWQLASFDIWCALAAWHTGRRILNTTIGVHTGTTRTTLQCNRTKANPTKINTEKQQKRKNQFQITFSSSLHTYFFKQYAHVSGRKNVFELN